MYVISTVFDFNRLDKWHCLVFHDIDQKTPETEIQFIYDESSLISPLAVFFHNEIIQELLPNILS